MLVYVIKAISSAHFIVDVEHRNKKKERAVLISPFISSSATSFTKHECLLCTVRNSCVHYCLHSHSNMLFNGPSSKSESTSKDVESSPNNRHISEYFARERERESKQIKKQNEKIQQQHEKNSNDDDE